MPCSVPAVREKKASDRCVRGKPHLLSPDIRNHHERNNLNPSLGELPSAPIKEGQHDLNNAGKKDQP